MELGALGGVGGRQEWMDLINIHYINIQNFQRIKLLFKKKYG